MFRYSTALLVAGFCVAGAAYAQVSTVDRVDHRVTADADSFRGDVSEEHWRDGDGFGKHDENLLRGRTATVETAGATGMIQGAQVAGDSSRIESQTQIREDQIARSDVQDVQKVDSSIQNSGDRADRSGPVPFADMGKVGGDTLGLTTQKAIDQDKQLLVRGEVIGEDLVLHLPAGTIHDTLSLRSGSGLHLSRLDVKRIGRFDGDSLHLPLAELRRLGNDDVKDLWVWGTGPKSASLLQRVAMNDVDLGTVASQDIPQRRSAGIGSTLGAPIRESSSIERDSVIQDDQIEKEKDMMKNSGLEKSTSDEPTHF